MKGNKLIATSIASMMLVAGMAMPKALAATTTESRYTKNYIDSNTYAIAVGLANKDTVLTKSELSDLVKTHGVILSSVTDPSNKEITSEEAQVPNGSIVTLSTGNKATVVLYGDVEADGKIDLNDVQAIFDASTRKRTLSGATFKAADVEVETSGDAKVDLNDVQRAFDYLYNTSAMENGLVVANPKLPENNSTFDENINLILTDEYVNNVNESSFPVKVSLNKALDTQKNYTLSVVDSKGNEVVTGPSVTFDPTSGETVISIDKTLSFASVADDGTFTIVLKEGTNVVASKTVQKISDKGPFPIATKIVTNRYNSILGQLGFSSLGSSDIVKVYYQVGGSKPNATTLVKAQNTKTLSVYGNKLDLTDLDATLTHEQPATVYFVVENSKGNIADPTNVYTATIAKDTTDVKAEKIAKSISPTATGNKTYTTITAGANFETDANSVKEYYLYNNGNLVDANATGVFNVTEPGNYTVGVVVKGKTTGETTDSEELKSQDPIVVNKLDKVSGIKFTELKQVNPVSDPNGKLTWNSSDSEAIAKYVVTLYKFNGTKFDAVQPSTDVTRTQDDNHLVKELNVKLDPNTLYKATIQTISVGGATYLELNSDLAETDTYFFVLSENVFNNAAPVSSTEIMLDVDKTNFKLGNEAISYDVEVWATVGGEGVDSHLERIDTRRNVIPTDKSTNTIDKLLINNLKPGTNYEFVLIVRVGNASAQSPKHTKATTTMSTLPSLQNLTVATKETNKDLPSGFVALDNSDIYIGNVKVDNTVTYEESKAIALLKLVLPSLVPGDKVSVTNDSVSVTILSKGTEAQGTLKSRSFGNLGEATLEITGNGFEQTVTTQSAKKVVLKGSGSRFDVAGVQANDIVVENGVVITKAPTSAFKVENQAVVEHVSVSAEGGDAVISTSNNGASVNVKSTNEASKLTLTNENEEPVIVTIESDSAGSESNLSVKVSAHGDITITPYTKVNGTIDVTLTNGTIDLTSPKLAGDYVVNMILTQDNSTGETITVPVSRLSIPEGLSLTNGTSYALKAEYQSTEYQGAANREQLISYLSGFDYKADQGVTLQISSDGTKAIFKFTKKINTTLSFSK